MRCAELKPGRTRDDRGNPIESGFTLGKLASAVAGFLFVAFLLDQQGFFASLPAVDRELQAALKGHDLVAVRAALDAGADLHHRDLTGGTYLHTAAFQGRKAMVELLVDRGLDPGVRDSHGVTPLHLAAAEGHVELVSWLIRAGAPVETAITAFVERCDGRDFQVGFTPLDVARQAGHGKVAAILDEAWAP